MSLVSIVIPVYNTAPFLRKCVESVLAQTLEDVEVICVEDNSSDNSKTILESIIDPRLRVTVFHQNRGVSAARNIGLAQARGEFIYFMDSDDWIDPDYLEVMVSHMMPEEIGIVMNTAVEPEMRGISCSKPMLYPSRLVASYAIPTVWNRLYRRKFLTDNKLTFPEDLTASEDYYFTKLAEYLSDHTLVFSGPTYHHTARPGSLSTRNTFDNICASKLLYDEMKRRGISTCGCKLFYAGHLLLDSADRFDFTRSFFQEIESEVKANPGFDVPFDLFCLDAVLSCDTYDTFCNAYNPNLSFSFVNNRFGHK